MRRLALPISGLAAALVAALLVAGIALAASFTNGSLEAGNLSGWTVKNNAPDPESSWYAYSGNRTPITGLKIRKPPEGKWAATTDQVGPGAHVLYQDVTLGAGSTDTLSFLLYYRNLASAFYTPSNLDPDTGTILNPNRNQQYRVDIIDPSADVFSVAASDVLAMVFRTEVGDPLKMKPTLFTFDLSPFAGKTIRLRFAEVDNQGRFLASVDDVQVGASPDKKDKEDKESDEE